MTNPVSKSIKARAINVAVISKEFINNIGSEYSQPANISIPGNLRYHGVMFSSTEATPRGGFSVHTFFREACSTTLAIFYAYPRRRLSNGPCCTKYLLIKSLIKIVNMSI